MGTLEMQMIILIKWLKVSPKKIAVQIIPNNDLGLVSESHKSNTNAPNNKPNTYIIITISDFLILNFVF